MHDKELVTLLFTIGEGVCGTIFMCEGCRDVVGEFVEFDPITLREERDE